jgi:hypothetical protein
MHYKEKIGSSTEKRQLIRNWLANWIELCDLVNQSIWPDVRPFGVCLPTDLHETRYQRLRFWFLIHEGEFLSLWNEYYSLKETTNGVATDSIENHHLQYNVFDKNFFGPYYNQENLYTLIQELDKKCGMDTQKPSNKPAYDVMAIMVSQIGGMLEKFVRDLKPKSTTSSNP